MTETVGAGWTADPGELLRFQVMLEMRRGESDCVEIASNLTSGPAEIQDVFQILIAEGLAGASPLRGGDTGPHDAYLNATGKALVRSWEAARTKSQEKRACTSAMLSWLDAHDGAHLSSVTALSDDVRGHYFGRPFDETAIRDAAHELHQHGLIEGLRDDDTVGRPQLTLLGHVVVTQHDGDVMAWMAASQSGASAGDTFHFTNSSGIAVASRSPHAQQSVHVSTDAREQVENVAAALEQMLESLGLEPADVARAYGLARQLRDAAEVVEVEPERARRVLGAVKAIAVNGTGSAAGTALVALVDMVAQSI